MAFLQSTQRPIFFSLDANFTIAVVRLRFAHLNRPPRAAYFFRRSGAGLRRSDAGFDRRRDPDGDLDADLRSRGSRRPALRLRLSLPLELVPLLELLDELELRPRLLLLLLLLIDDAADDEDEDDELRVRERFRERDGDFEPADDVAADDE
jgi:hypothetical protein